MEGVVPSNYLVTRQREMKNMTRYLNELITKTPSAGWHYKEFGKQVEAPIIKYFGEKGLLASGKYLDQSSNKNEIPDIIDNQYSKPIFIDIKAGNVVEYATGNKVSNAGQDLSTTTSWRDKVFAKFDGELCFFIEVKYHHLKGHNLSVVECEIDHFYKFVGKNKEGLISHRRRNVRPRPWSSRPLFNSADEFKQLLSKTISFSIKSTLYNSDQDLTREDKIELRNYFNRMNLD